MNASSRSKDNSSPSLIYADLLRSLIGPVGRQHVLEQLEAEYVARGWRTLDQCMIPVLSDSRSPERRES